jgi:leucyl/phenylalanyl-tRNA--protein transferase
VIETFARREDTWINREIIESYTRMHELGHAHSVEAWADGELAGGLYGVAVGRIFYGESMFSRRSNASKVAVSWLTRQLDRWQFELIDCQMSTEHLASLGAREIPRADFLRRLERGTALPPVPVPWVIEDDLMRDL